MGTFLGLVRRSCGWTVEARGTQAQCSDLVGFWGCQGHPVRVVREDELPSLIEAGIDAWVAKQMKKAIKKSLRKALRAVPVPPESLEEQRARERGKQIEKAMR